VKQDRDLANLLDEHMKRAAVGDARLASMVNSIAEDEHFIHRSTIRNWRNGSARRVNNCRQLSEIATALHLDEQETRALLKSGGCPHASVHTGNGHMNGNGIQNGETQPVTQTSEKNWQIDDQPVKFQQPASDLDEVRPQQSKQVLSVEANGLTTTYTWRLTSIFIVLFGAIPLGYLLFKLNTNSTEPGNVLLNSSFENDAAQWVSYVNDRADANFSLENESMRIRVNQSGSKNWHIQLFQQSVSITGGESYTLKFRVRGDGNTSFKTDVTRAVDPKTSLGFGNSVRTDVTTTTEWEQKTIEFQASASMSLADGGARVLFDIGKSDPGWILIDDVELYQGKP